MEKWNEEVFSCKALQKKSFSALVSRELSKKSALDVLQYKNDLMNAENRLVLKLPRFSLAYAVREKAR